MSKRYIIDGMFLCQTATGIQRYAKQIVTRLDHHIAEEDIEIEILIPSKRTDDWTPKNMRLIEGTMKLNCLKKILWTNWTLPAYAKKRGAKVISFCNRGPIWNAGIVCIHDIMYKSDARYFPIKNRVMPRLYYFFNTKYATKIVTVSEYVRNEIIKYYRVEESRICVIGNGWEHISTIQEDKRFLDEWGLRENGYYISVGNISPHKNLKWVIEEAKVNPSEKFVIVGKCVLGLSQGVEFIPKNVIFTGYVSDLENITLMKNAKALLFPSFCEGFGIPPLEMLAMGKKIIISKQSCLPGIFGPTAIYIDPNSHSYVLENLLETKTDEDATRSVLVNNSWDHAASCWLNLLMNRI